MKPCRSESWTYILRSSSVMAAGRGSPETGNTRVICRVATEISAILWLRIAVTYMCSPSCERVGVVEREQVAAVGGIDHGDFARDCSSSYIDDEGARREQIGGDTESGRPSSGGVR